LDYLHLGWNLPQIQDKKAYLEKVNDFARSSMRMLRETIWALNQAEVSSSSLKSKIQDYARLCLHQERIQFHFKFDASIEQINSSVALNCFRIIQEALSNTMKYAEARNFWLEMHFDSTRFKLKIKDDGKGFQMEEAQKLKGHYGLKNMKMRATDMKASFDISADSDGTNIEIMHQ
jgi:signal transduction histidine kinase